MPPQTTMTDVLLDVVMIPYPERMIVYSNAKDGKIVFRKLQVNEER